MTGLVALAALTGGDILLGVPCDPWPVDGAADSVVGLLETKVASYGGVMGVMKKRETNFRLPWDAHQCGVITGDAEQVVNKRVTRRTTSLEAAFIDRAQL